MNNLPLNEYITGDCIEVMREWPDKFIQCVITSPPYWGLRIYGDDGQYGLESTPEEHIAKMVEVGRELWRVLRKDGVVFLNYGDSYWGGGQGSGHDEYTNNCGRKTAKYGITRGHTQGKKHPYLKPKDLCMIPARVAIALQQDGWWLRSDIIWAKPNPMPESCTDRPTSSYEHIFLLTKSLRYFYDADAVREKQSEMTIERLNSEETGDPGQKNLSRSGLEKPFWGKHRVESIGRNLRNVWTVPTHPFAEAHFATFPPALVKRCVLAGTSHKACEVCGAAWERVVEKGVGISKECPKTQAAHEARGGKGIPAGTVGKSGSGRINGYSATLGFRPTCSCEQKGTGKCIVLDPFMGSGTVAVVAQELGRDWIGIDLGGKDGEYKKMAMTRLQGATIGLNFE